MLGLVIPVFQKKYIKSCVASIVKTCGDMNIRVCIVNDGQSHLVEYLNNLCINNFIEVLHLDENVGFAGANNAGWSYLIEHHPEINFLGTLNDDTKVHPGCFQNLIDSFVRFPNAGMVGSIQYVPDGVMSKSCLSLWGFGGGQERVMELIANHIYRDLQCAVLPGHCFVCLRETLLSVNMFDENYVNSCDDADLSLLIRRQGKDLYVIHNSVITHYAGKSRYQKNASKKITLANDYLVDKWGADLSIYNDLAYFYRA